jgi:hypothetical protein
VDLPQWLSGNHANAIEAMVALENCSHGAVF